MRTKFAAIALAAALAACASPSAQAQRGDHLGSRTVADHTEVDNIQVTGARRHGAVRLCVQHRSVNFRDVDIHFANGGHQDVAVRAIIGPGECTRWINLSGERRNITRITLRYQTIVNAGQQAIVSAFGR